MPPENTVIDEDHGYRKIWQRMLDAEDMQAKIGWLSGRPKYPKDRGGTAVAKVAGVQIAVRKLGKAWDNVEAAMDARLKKAYGDMLDGLDPRDAVIDAAMILQDEFRALVKSEGLVVEGFLAEEIRFSVTQKTGGRGRPRKIGGDL